MPNLKSEALMMECHKTDVYIVFHTKLLFLYIFSLILLS